MTEDLLNAVISKFGELLEQSEKRIEKTNEMVCKLANACEHNNSVVEKLINEYSMHLDGLKQNRDALAEQNGRLIQIVHNAQQQSMNAEERNRILFDKLIDKMQIGANTSKSDIHIAK